MIIIGTNSEVAQAFAEKILKEGNRYPCVYLFSSNVTEAQRFARHLEAKFQQVSEVVPINLMDSFSAVRLENISSNLLFCAAGFLGKSPEEALLDERNTEQILRINFTSLIPLLTYFAQKMEENGGGTLIGLSSVAGERGRQSNFVYGSAKAGFTAYLSGLRNFYARKKVHVMTVKPGFMDTKMTEGLPLNPKLTATPEQAAAGIYSAYKRRKNVVYVLPTWRWIMLIIRNIPEFIFKKLKL